MNNQILNCRTCGHVISINADMCPNCGEPNRRQSHSLAFNWHDPVHAVGGVLAIIMSCGIFVMFVIIIYAAIFPR